MPYWLDHLLTNPRWVGGATWGAGLITIVGLALTYWQARKARSAAEAARSATHMTLRELDLRAYMSGLGEAGQLATRVKEYASLGNPQAARLALEMLRAKLDSLEATADDNLVVSQEHRDMDGVLGVMERHIDEAANSRSVKLDANMLANQMNNVRRILSKRIERVKRSLPEDRNV